MSNHDTFSNIHKAPEFYRLACETSVTAASASSNGLRVDFSDQSTQTFPWFWVRDHCVDPLSLDHTCLQRLTDTFSIPSDISCSEIEVDLEEQLITLKWPDQTSSEISAYMLASNSGRANARHDLSDGKKRVLWDKASPLDQIPTVQYSDVMNDDEALLQWLENIYLYGFCIAEGVPATERDTDRLAIRIGTVQETLFGTMWPLSSELVDHGDSAYSNSYLEPHTDGTYYHDAPGLQMFNCLEIDCKGGESVQVDGFALAQRLKIEDPDAFKTLTEISVPGHYVEPGVHVRAERPVIKLDAQGALLQVSFNNYDRAPMLLPQEDSERFHHAYSLFHKHLIDQEHWKKIPLSPGKTLVFDNWRNMHGRMGYVGKRYFYGCYHSRSVFESQLRVLRASKQ